MTKAEKLQYLQDYVASQGTQAGLSIAALLEEIINGNDDVFVVNVEDNEAEMKNVTNAQDEIDAFVDAVNADPLHNIPKVFISGAVLTFAQLEVTEDVVNGSVSVAGGSYALTLSKETGQSKVVYTAG